MAKNQKLINHILSKDGSTRDINFTPIDKSHLIDFINALLIDYRFDFLRDGEGIDLEPDINILQEQFDLDKGYLHGLLVAENYVIPIIQIFVFWNQSNKPKKFEVELSTFFNSKYNPISLLRESPEAFFISKY
jgi:hypothetical protein